MPGLAVPLLTAALLQQASPAPVPLPSQTRTESMVAAADSAIELRAVRLAEPLTLDGALGEEIYGTVSPTSGFVQQYPLNGEPATEDTEVWVFFDSDYVYVGLRAWDSQPDRMVANEMRRDNRNIWQNDNVVVLFDTFLDRRSAFFFQTNPLGGVRDALVINESATNYDWNTVWDVKSRRDDRGWTAEMQIPFKSLRYTPGPTQVWGFQIQRVVRSKNEQTLLSPVPSNAGGGTRMAFAATLVGIEAPTGSRNIELRPYGISTLTTDRPSGVSNDLNADVGIDAKYGITSSLGVDFTYNTDFAQVEIDEQQVNLSRFSLFLPEKREFFLEGQGVFDFAGSGGTGGRALGGGPAPRLFFSRRIGISGGGPVPIQQGGRLMGRVGPVSMGVLNIQTDDVPVSGSEATNFSVVRVKSDFLRRSNVGMILTRRSPSLFGEDSNVAYGADANLLFHDNLRLTGYYARSSTTGIDGNVQSYQGKLDYDSDRYGLQAEVLRVGDAFRPEVGFLLRDDFRRTFASGRFSPRLTASRYVRQLTWEGSFDRFVNGADVLETRQEKGTFSVEFNSSDEFSLEVSRNFESLDEGFQVADLFIPAGSYSFYELMGELQLGPQRRVSGTLRFNTGGFFGGNRTGLGYTGRVELSSRFAVEPRLSFDWISRPEADTRVTLAGVRPTLTITPRMYVAALVQYNSSTGALETNARWRWEFEPGSDLFVVYTDGRDTTGRGFSRLVNRGLAIKLTRFLRF